MNITPEGYIERLNEAITKKLKLLKDLHTLTLQQSTTINEDGVERLSILVSEKQKVIDQADKLDEQFQVYFEGLKRALKIESLEEIKGGNIKGIKELQESIIKIREIASEISSIESANFEKAKCLLSDFGSEIKKLNQGKKITTTYYPPPIKAPSHFIDKRK